MNDPNIARVYNFSIENTTAFIMQEYVDGGEYLGNMICNK